jgi:hypothetical protein
VIGGGLDVVLLHPALGERQCTTPGLRPKDLEDILQPDDFVTVFSHAALPFVSTVTDRSK